MSAIAAFRTAVLALLDDPTIARYTAAQVDAALRQALYFYSMARPLIYTYNVDGCDDYEIEMPADFSAFNISEVFLDNSDDPPTPVVFYAFKRDEHWFIHTSSRLIASTEAIMVTYSLTHTIDGLDGAAGTTIPIEDEPILQVGAAGYAAFIRSNSHAESINMQPSVSGQLLKWSLELLKRFQDAISTHQSAGYADLPAIPTNKF